MAAGALDINVILGKSYLGNVAAGALNVNVILGKVEVDISSASQP